MSMKSTYVCLLVPVRLQFLQALDGLMVRHLSRVDTGICILVSGVNYLCRSASIIFAGFSFPFFHSFVVVGDSFHLLI